MKFPKKLEPSKRYSISTYGGYMFILFGKYSARAVCAREAAQAHNRNINDEIEAGTDKDHDGNDTDAIHFEKLQFEIQKERARYYAKAARDVFGEGVLFMAFHVREEAPDRPCYNCPF